MHEVTFASAAATVGLGVNAWTDLTAESTVQTLQAEIQAAANGEYTLGSPYTASAVVTDVNGDLTDAATITIDSPQTSPQEGSANNVTFRFNRSGGDTTQPLTIAIRVEDPDGALRGNHWDTPPEMPTQVEFAGNETTKTLRIPLPDDQRDLTDPEVKAVLLPSGNVIGGEYGSSTFEEVTVGDNDTAQQLELNFGKDGANDADVDEGDTLKVVVKRRQQDAGNGTTASLTIRVESDRMGVDHVLDGWDSLPGNNGVYKDFPIEITGSDTEVEQIIDVPENGVAEDDWTYTASIRSLEDHEGNALAAAQEAQYWTVKPGFRETEIDATDSGDSTGTVTIAADQASIHEGQEALFTLTRAGGPMGAPVTVDLESSESNRLDTTKNNPSIQAHQVTMAVADYRHPWRGRLCGQRSGGRKRPSRSRDHQRWGAGYTAGNPNTQTVEIDDPPNGVAIVTVVTTTTTVAEGNTASFDLTRAGGDTTAELTVDIRLDDPSEFLRGNHFDAAPDLPSQVTFAADSTSTTVTLTVPDDQRDVPDGSFTLFVQPSGSYYLGNTGLATSAVVSVTDNDDAQQLRLWWGFIDGCESSWEQGESYYEYCTTRETGPAEGLFYYDDDRNFRVNHELEEPWPAHFRVTRRAQDVGKTVTFVVRVEHNRRWENPRHADWPTDPVTGNRYQEFPITLTGNQRQVVGRIELVNNGRLDPGAWEFTAEIKRIEDVSDGTVLTADQEAQYWTVRERGDSTRRNTIRPGERGRPTISLGEPTPNPVAEGGQVTLEVRQSAASVEPLDVRVRTWEPNRVQPDGTNPTEQVHTITFPAVPITDQFVLSPPQTQTFTVTTMDDTDYETSDVLKAQVLSAQRVLTIDTVRLEVDITDDDLAHHQPVFQCAEHHRGG